MQKSGNYETMKVWITACILMVHSVKKTHIFKEKNIYLKGSKHVLCITIQRYVIKISKDKINESR